MFICHERGTKKNSESPTGIEPEYEPSKWPVSPTEPLVERLERPTGIWEAMGSIFVEDSESFIPLIFSELPFLAVRSGLLYSVLLLLFKIRTAIEAGFMIGSGQQQVA